MNALKHAFDNYATSAIFRGWVKHQRYTPIKHGFTYPVFMLYANLDELEKLNNEAWYFSTKHFAPLYLNTDDYLPLDSESTSLKERVKKTIYNKTQEHYDGMVTLLTNPRYFGFQMNPISCFYCFDKSGKNLEYFIAEVTNTPWKERVSYVLPCTGPNRKYYKVFDKAMHVSPFNPMEMKYHCYFNYPYEKLYLHLENWQADDKITDATLSLKRTNFNYLNLLSCFIKQPFQTITTATRIYVNALKLKIKGATFFSHPNRALKQATKET